MLMRFSVFAAGIVGAAMLLPGLATSYLSTGDAPTPAVTAQQPTTPASYASSRGVVLTASDNGHFVGTFTINGRKESGLVDTGASVIAINTSTARRLGISVASLPFDRSASTANGIVKAAMVTLDRVEIGNISVRDVDAMVLPDKSLSGMLVGMSFLGRLSGYRVEDGALRLMQ